jgi:hypothetical protein
MVTCSLREFADPDSPEAFAGTLMDGLDDEPVSLLSRLRQPTMESFGAWMFVWGAATGCAIGYTLRWVGV